MIFIKIKFKNKFFNIKKFFKNIFFKKKKVFLKIFKTKNMFKKICFIRNYIFKIISKFIIFNFLFKKIKYYFLFLNFFYKKNIFFKKKFYKLYFKIFKNLKKIFIKKTFLIYNNFLFFKKNIKLFIINSYYIKNFIFIIYKIKLFILKKNLFYFKKKIKKYKYKILSEEYQEYYLIFKSIIFNYNYNENRFHNYFNWKIKSSIFKKKKKIKKELVSLEIPNFNNYFKKNNYNKELFFLKEYDKKNFINLIRSIILEFSEREQKILRLRFGIGYSKSYTLEEVGIIYGLTKERIRQIELKTVIKLRHPSRLEVLKPYISLLKSED